jgi:hypothetical protein
LRFVACDRGRLGGGVGEPDDVGGGESVERREGESRPFVVPSPSIGTKFDRERETMRFGGDAVRSIAEAARAGGGGRAPFDDFGTERPGDAV